MRWHCCVGPPRRSMRSTTSTASRGATATSELMSYQIFSRLVDVLEGEPLQKLHTCSFNGAEAWRLLTKKYAPTTALRGMQLMLSVVNAPRAKTQKDVSKCIDIWEARV